METIKEYHKQNKLQREVNRLINIFKVDWTKINQLKSRGIGVYNLGASKKEKIGVGLIAFSITCPCTAAPLTVPLCYKIFLGRRK